MFKFITDRSNLDEVISIGKDESTGKYTVKTTRRQYLERGAFLRNDVVLVNGERSGLQYTLYVTETGYSGDMFLLDILTDEEYVQLQLIAERMRQNARTFPPAKRMLVG